MREYWEILEEKMESVKYVLDSIPRLEDMRADCYTDQQIIDTLEKGIVDAVDKIDE
jgi:hypothetical protein